MKWPSLNTILWVAVAILLTLYLKSCFDKTPPDEKIIRLEIQNQQLEKQRIVDSVNLKEARDWYDSLLIVSNQRFTDLQNKKTPIINVIKKVGNTVDGFDKQQLHSGAEHF